MILVRGLPLPPLLTALLNAGLWRHPGDDVLRRMIPWLRDPVDLLNVDQMRRESGALERLDAEVFRLGRGQSLPWLDPDQAVLIAVNRHAGNDVAIALDHRAPCPLVVASDCGGDAWRAVSPTFAAFAAALGLVRTHPYVGPAEFLEATMPGGCPISSLNDLETWMAGQSEETFTFVIDVQGRLRLAPQRSEHVACAQAEAVLSAGEITFVRDREGWAVAEVSNQSTGYCPDTTSWPVVQAALADAGIDPPGAFTHPIVFRRCPWCGQRNIVKDDHFVCGVCDGVLPDVWNCDSGGFDGAT